MESTLTKSALQPSDVAAAEQELRDHQLIIYRRTDRMFAFLMVIQWLAGIAVALWISPRAWEGSSSYIHPHVMAAIFLGFSITAFPTMLAVFRPGATSTRYTISIAQMLMGALLIHLTGGRIETHFHIFGSLAFLAFYRDWKVLVPATLLVAADHFSAACSGLNPYMESLTPATGAVLNMPAGYFSKCSFSSFPAFIVSAICGTRP